MKLSISGSALLQKLAVIYLIVWTISPFMEIDMIWRLLALGSAAVWFLIEFSRSGTVVGRLQGKAVLFAAAVAAIAFIQSGNVTGVLRQIAMYILVICFLMNYYYQDRWEELSGIVPIVLLLLFVFNFRSAQAVISDPTIARMLVRDDEHTYAYLRQGIGGYSLIYPQVVIFPAILAWVQKAFRHKITYFVIGFMWLASYILLILSAGYSIAIVTTIIGLFMLYFYKGNNAIGAFFAAFVVFLIGLGSILYFDVLRDFLLVVFDGTAVAKKINDLVLSAQSGVAEGSIFVRVKAYRYSLDALLKYPIVGALWRGGGGGHSAVLDVFAKYGLWGGPIYASMLYYVPNYYRRYFADRRIVVIANATLVTMLFVTILDSCTYAFMGMMLLVLPLLFEDIRKWSEIM